MNDDYPDEGEQPSEEWLAGYQAGLRAATRESAGAGLDVAIREIENLTSWPRVSMFAYDAQVRGVPVNPTEDRVVIDRDAVLAILARIAAARLPEPPA